MTDVVDRTAVTVQIGDRRAAELPAAHDRIARDLLGHRDRDRRPSLQLETVIAFGELLAAEGAPEVGRALLAFAAEHPAMGQRSGATRCAAASPRSLARGRASISTACASPRRRDRQQHARRIETLRGMR